MADLDDFSSADRRPEVEALPAELDVTGLWQAVVGAVKRYARRSGVRPADMVVLLPFAQHLPLARAAWAAHGDGWMPRFETTLTLAEALGPAPLASHSGPCFDGAIDRLVAARMLAESAPDWPRRDARGFDLAARRVVDLAHALAYARAACPPAQRPAWIVAGRERLNGSGGPAQAERVLARVAFEWSLDASTDAADALFAHRPAAWVGVRVGARDALAEALLATTNRPALWLDANRSPALLPVGGWAIAPCADFEDEAQRAAASVLDALGDRSDRSVALIALDRVLVRRVQALLARKHVPVADETGWKLSTTRAGASVMSLLRAAVPRADTDALIECLKSLPDATDVDALEAVIRRARWTAITQVDARRLPETVQPLWSRWETIAEPLRRDARDTLAGWIERLTESLRRAGLLDALASDAAGEQVLATLRCCGTPDPAFADVAGRTVLSLGGALGWVDGVLEQASFRPPSETGAAVVITPLSRALLRPFSAIVCPGADGAHLGVGGVPEPLLGDAFAVALGLPGVVEGREAERLAFAQLGRAPTLTLLHRRSQSGEPVSASPLLARWQIVAARLGWPVTQASDARIVRELSGQATPRPLPVAAEALWPTKMSASRYEQLRACPYRYYALTVLGLNETEELDDELEKRDAGDWLHRVLQRFHAEREGGNAGLDDVSRLRALAVDETRECFGESPAAADFLPYAAWFDGLAPAYVDWLHAVEAEGWAFEASERELDAPLDEAALRLHGRLDRVDHRHVDEGDARGHHRRLIDYKLRSKAALQSQVRSPFEDTQLAFYGALLGSAEGWPEGGIEAGYLALDGRDGVAWVAHPEVADSAQALLEGLVSDVERLRAGAALPALGEGAACEHCAARGLCRRDFWAPMP